MMSNNDYPTDTQLVSRFQNGDLNALEQLIEKYKDKIYTSIFFLVKDKYLAEDIFQETFIRVIDTLRSGRYNEEGKVLPWIMRIAHNLCVDHFRKLKRVPLVNTDQNDMRDIFDVVGVHHNENAETKRIRQETYQLVSMLLDHLPASQREVLVLRHYGDMSFKEIARLTDCSINTALGRMRYGLLNLRKLMATYQIEL
ncbi:RNA polymerase sigma factor [Arachidicoccus terrestris]|uniref:RNA polymerase sigma factor n=1 Tax=Arachidicoccus terrestris TaxID=2875539 RepID=UPI00293D6D0B|nr:sigma-70 family RNA polymerase sigma factor [Arachidicoccus terrestris]